DRAELALKAVALAQQSSCGKAAPVAEFGEIHSYDAKVRQIISDGRGFLVAVQPKPERDAAAEQRFPLRAPQRGRHDDVSFGRDRGQAPVRPELKPLPGIGYDVLVFYDDRHTHPS